MIVTRKRDSNVLHELLWPCFSFKSILDRGLRQHEEFFAGNDAELLKHGKFDASFSNAPARIIALCFASLPIRTYSALCNKKTSLTRYPISSIFTEISEEPTATPFTSVWSL